MEAADLIAFEDEISYAFQQKRIKAPIHLSGGNEEQLIEIFKQVKRSDYVCSTWRSHYHALLRGIPPERIKADILAGKSMMLHYPEYRFLTSAIVGGILPIACGLAAAGKAVWCFVGDMAASTGAFRDALHYTQGQFLDVTFVIEDNGLATNTPTREAWGIDTVPRRARNLMHYEYEREHEHVGCGVYVAF